MDTDRSPLLRVHDARDDVRALGPAVAAAIWVQGCLRGCAGCMTPDSFDPAGGALAEITAIADWLAATGRRFLTISGGEPMDQAEALVALIDLIRSSEPWIVTCYTGHRIEELRATGARATTALLDRLDLLIDGPYIESRHEPLLWRGSANQRIHNLSGRVALPADEPVGIDVHFDADLAAFQFIGVPPTAGFLETFVDLWPAGRGGATHVAAPTPLPFPTNELS